MPDKPPLHICLTVWQGWHPSPHQAPCSMLCLSHFLWVIEWFLAAVLPNIASWPPALWRSIGQTTCLPHLVAPLAEGTEFQQLGNVNIGLLFGSGIIQLVDGVMMSLPTTLGMVVDDECTCIWCISSSFSICLFKSASIFCITTHWTSCFSCMSCSISLNFSLYSWCS